MIGLDDLCLATGGQLYGDAVTREFTGISHDSTTVQPGDLFVVSSLPGAGQEADIERALGRGAAGLLCEEPPTRDVTNTTTVLVGDARLGLEQWAAFAIRQYHPLSIAVIGDGAEGVCSALSAALGSRYPVHVSHSEVDGPYQIPMEVSTLEPQHVYAIFSPAAGKFNALADMMSILQPQIVVFSTPISMISGAYGQPMTALPDEIASVIRRLPARGTIVANIIDSPALLAAKPETVRLVTYSDVSATGGQSGADVIPERVRFAIDSAVVDIRIGKDGYKDVLLSGIGTETINSDMAAIATCVPLDFPIRDALGALGARTTSGGLKITSTPAGVYFIDAGAIKSADRVLSLLDWVDGLGTQVRRRFLILGELGPGGDQHIELCHAIGRRSIVTLDAVVALHETSGPVVLAARRGGFPVEASLVPNQREEVEGFLKPNLGPEDLVIMAGGQTRMGAAVVNLLSGGKSQSAGQPAHVDPGSAVRGGRSWLEVDLQAITANTVFIRRQLQEGTRLIAVVRDDAFHHGLVEASRAIVDGGVDILGVGSLADAVSLRGAGLQTPILLLGYEPPGNLEEAVSRQLLISVHSRTQAEMLALIGRKMKARAACHIKVSTSPNDSGVSPREVIALVRELKKADQVGIDGMYMTFAPAPGPNWAADGTRQLREFGQLVHNLSAAGVDIPHVHAGGSAAMLTLQNSIFSAARVGHLLYGLSPFSNVSLPAGLRPALTWKTSISDLVVEQPKQRGGGQTRRLGVIPVGQRDGLIIPGRGGQQKVLLGGIRATLTGANGPDWTQLDITHIPQALIGSEVVIVGVQGNERITIEEVTSLRGGATIDTLLSLSPSLPIRYSGQGG